jgi:hypothetical protein
VVQWHTTSNTVSGGNTTFGVFKNGVATAHAHTVAPGVNDDATTTADVDYAPGDTFQVQVTHAAGGVNAQTAICDMWLEWEAGPTPS